MGTGETGPMTKTPDLDSAYALSTPDDNLRLYGDWAETYDADFVDAKGFRFPRLVAETWIAEGAKGPCLDVGCGTGAVADHLPDEVEVHGLDLSPQMLAVAAKKGRYAKLIEANLIRPLAIADATYASLTSSGTFTHGHVGGAALFELARVLRPGGLAVVSIRDQIWDSMGFANAFAQLVRNGTITAPERRLEVIYASPDTAPEGHGGDQAYLTTFRRL